MDWEGDLQVEMEAKVPELVALPGELEPLQNTLLLKDAKLEGIQVCTKAKSDYIKLWKGRMEWQRDSFAKTQQPLKS